MINKKTLPVVGLLLLLAGAIAIGIAAYQEPGIRVPPGSIVRSPSAGSPDSSPERVAPHAPDLPATSERTLFQDSFDTLSGWAVIGSPESPANWVSNQGRLEIWGDMNGNPTGDESVFANSNAIMDDGTFQLYVYPTGGEPVGLVFRGSDLGYYRLDLYPNIPGPGTRAALHRVTGNKGEQIATAATYAGYENGKWQLVTVTAQGDRITAQVDGQTILEATDSAFPSGWTGVWTTTGFGAQFDNARLLAGSR